MTGTLAGGTEAQGPLLAAHGLTKFHGSRNTSADLTTLTDLMAVGVQSGDPAANANADSSGPARSA